MNEKDLTSRNHREEVKKMDGLAAKHSDPFGYADKVIKKWNAEEERTHLMNHNACIVSQRAIPLHFHADL